MKFRVLVPVTVLVVITLYLLFKPDEQSKRARRLESSLHQKGTPFWQQGSDPSATGSFFQSLNKADSSHLKQHALQYFRYPRNSRPLDTTMVDLLQPLAVKSEVKVFKDPDDPEPLYICRLGGQYGSVSDRHPLKATFRCTDDRSGKTTRPALKEMYITSDFKSGQQRLSQPVELKEDGDTLFLNWSLPGGNYDKRPYWGELELTIVFTVDELDEQTIRLNFFSTPDIPARFTGHIDEELDDGSLVLKPVLEVNQSGMYMVQASLYIAGQNEPVSWAFTRNDLEKGQQQVRLVFFGKIFHDKKAEGRFELRDLRGHRNNVPFMASDMGKLATGELKIDFAENEPHKQMMPYLLSPYQTAEYELDNFSDRVYEGPDKQKMLNMADESTSPMPGG